MACFSFHPVKTIAMGEGGAVTTNDPLLYDRMKLGRSHGMVREPSRFELRDLAFDEDGQANPWYYEMPNPGYNYRANDFQCALGLSQLSKLGWFSGQRKSITSAYDARFRDFPDHIQPIRRLQSCDPVLHLYVLAIQFAKTAAKTRGKAMRALAARGIGTQVHYLPVHMQPYYQRRYGNRRFEGAEAYYNSCLSIPIYPGLSEPDIDRVVNGLKKVLLAGE
jgi:dTDP-4-amino-4,6-dideoxygalactose transaminase